jgi:CubicO group peptidase (beta-lactamase class C family)
MRRKTMTAVILITLVMTGSALAQTGPIPATPAGKRLAELLSAVETDDGAKARAFVQGFAKSFLERLPEEKHIQFFEQIHEDQGGFAIIRIDESKDHEVTATVKGKRSGQYGRLTLRIETSPPYRINGIRLALTSPPQGQISRPGNDSHVKKSEPETLAELEKYLDWLVRANKFAGAVLVAKNGRPIFRKAYGLASREYDVPNRLDTKFNLGSINKIFTQIAIGQLIEQGTLSLDETIGRHLPDYPNHQARESVTVRHLLEMSSGIGDIHNEKYRSTPKDRIRTIEDYLPLFASEPLAFEPGTRYLYSNGGYIVLGAIIEKVSGQSYYDYVREHIFKPAGMEHTDYYQADDIVPNCASGYTRGGEAAAKDAPLRNNFYTRPARGSSAGGGYSTIDDLLKFVHALESGELLIPNFQAQASAPGATDQPSGGGSLSISGGAPGINAVLETKVAGTYTIIVLSNLDPPSAEMVAEQIRTWLGTGEN